MIRPIVRSRRDDHSLDITTTLYNIIKRSLWSPFSRHDVLVCTTLDSRGCRTRIGNLDATIKNKTSPKNDIDVANISHTAARIRLFEGFRRYIEKAG